MKDQRPRAPASVDNIGIGVTQVPEFFSGMPKIVSDIFAGTPVAGVFVISDAAQKGQDGGCRRADRGHHRQQKAGINA